MHMFMDLNKYMWVDIFVYVCDSVYFILQITWMSWV